MMVKLEATDKLVSDFTSLEKLMTFKFADS